MAEVVKKRRQEGGEKKKIEKYYKGEKRDVLSRGDQVRCKYGGLQKKRKEKKRRNKKENSTKNLVQLREEKSGMITWGLVLSSERGRTRAKRRKEAAVPGLMGGEGELGRERILTMGDSRSTNKSNFNIDRDAPRNGGVTTAPECGVNLTPKGGNW